MKLHTTAVLSTMVLLAACGGSSGSDPMPPPAVSNEVPASAYAGTDAFTRYARSLAPSDTDEPLDVSKVVAPTSETEEPREI